jgi:peptidylprolyl isomerase
MQNTAQTGNTVSVHYTGTFEDGTVFDTSHNREEPMTFQVGAGQLIAGFDQAIPGMSVGEVKKVSLSPEEGYGPRLDEAMQEVPKTVFPNGFDFQEGQIVGAQNPDGSTFQAVVGSVGEDTVMVDMNHPMAGKSLNFEIELVNIL